jgi:hypothetical protein
MIELLPRSAFGKHMGSGTPIIAEPLRTSGDTGTVSARCSQAAFIRIVGTTAAVELEAENYFS